MALDPITTILDIGSKVLDKIFPDPIQRDAAKLELLRLQQTGELAELAATTDLSKGQLEINKIEAANANFFVSGWRSAVGWVCALAFAYHFFLQPFLAFSLAIFGQEVKLPVFDMDTLLTVLLGILGLGTMRSIEKVKGVAQ